MKSETCECQTWATDCMVIGSHHYRCDKFDPKPMVELIAKLVDGISYWASLEDGVPQELWEAYVDASELTGRPVNYEPT